MPRGRLPASLRVQPRPAVATPPGEARPDDCIVFEFAHRLGHAARLQAARAARDNAYFFPGMHALTFRPAVTSDSDDSGDPCDLDRIMAMETAGFAAAHRESRAVYAQRISAFADGALIAMLGQNVVGCFFSEIWMGSDDLRAEHFRLGHDIGERHDVALGDELYITSLTLDPDWRERGLGSALFAGGIAHVARAHPQLRSALLLVNTQWQRARRIYLAQGFREITRFPGFFAAEGAAGEDGIVMRRAIATGAPGDEPPPQSAASR